MEAAPTARLRAWVERDAVDLLDAPDLARLRPALAGPPTAGARVTVAPHGTAACHLATRPGGPFRRVLEFDRAGHLLAALRWRADDALAMAWVRIPDGSWLAVEPGVEGPAPWTRADRLWQAAHPARRLDDGTATPLTVFAALDWARIGAIPPLAEPVRLPPGGGTTVLNLIAALALDQGGPPLRYRGPYPTEQLFLALLESFRYAPAVTDPLGAFMAGGLEWLPAPHERCFTDDGVCVQLRGRVEKVVARGLTYHRPDWHGVTRHAPRRVRDVAGGVACSLWVLGAALEDHLLLSAAGDVRALRAPGSERAASRPMAPDLWAGVVAAVAASSAPALAAPIGEVGRDHAPEWGPVAGDLVAVEGDRMRVAGRLGEHIAARLAATADRRQRASLALAAVAELAALLGDVLRARAQARLAAATPEAQAAALVSGATARAADDEATTPPTGPARAITRAAAALLAASGGGVDDHPDVEGDEGPDR